MNKNQKDISQGLLGYSKKFGELSLLPANSYKTNVYIGDKFVFKVSEQDTADSKESKVLNLIHERIMNGWKGVVPQITETQYVDGVGFVQVQTKLPGSHPKEISHKLLSDLGKFLGALHGSGTYELINEFDEKEEISFNNYLATTSQKFLSMLEKVVGGNDLVVLNNAVSYINRYLENNPPAPNLVLIHKDIHLNNLLVDSVGGLSGVVDWGASQTGPVEWEFSILKQRFPKYYDEILESYGFKTLNQDLLSVCGLIQSMRFWKSFPDDVEFVADQRGYIKEILDKNF